ncbi:MAG TPA: hypothetical protein VIY48_01240 [Candidatus Paceibacterota bacterium]
MEQHTVDTLATVVLREPLTQIAKKAAKEALSAVNVAEILDQELPGLDGKVRELVLESAKLMVESIVYVGIVDPSEARYMKEEAWQHGDAMVATFDAPAVVRD